METKNKTEIAILSISKKLVTGGGNLLEKLKALIDGPLNLKRSIFFKALVREGLTPFLTHQRTRLLLLLEHLILKKKKI